MNLKKYLVLAIICLLVSILSMVFIVKASAESISDRNYMKEMIEAAVIGDIELGRELEYLRNDKIDEMNLLYTKVSFDELFLLSKLGFSENNHSWASDEIILCTNQVVLNRMVSPEFPDTMEEVVYQKGQYYWANKEKFKTLLPDERHVQLALRLLEGERVMPESVIFQSNSPIGGEIYKEIYDKYLDSTMYFCYSSNMHLYEK